MRKLVAKIKSIMTATRLAVAGLALLVSCGAVYGKPLLQQLIPSWGGSQAQLEGSPSATLAAMTDDDLRAFAVNNRLPGYLQSNDWVRAEIIRKSLRDELPMELVKRWSTQTGGMTSSEYSSGTSAVSGQSSFDVAKPGALGVQTVQRGIGLAITQIYANSSAAQAGLSVGDVILTVNYQRVATTSDLVRQLRSAAGADGFARIEILRNGNRYVATANVSGRSGQLANRGNQRGTW